MQQQTQQVIKNVTDGGAVVAAWVAYAELLTAWVAFFAAVFSLLWGAFRLWELVTGKPFSESRLAKWIVSRFRKRQL